MAIDTVTPRSRRALLVATAGGLAALAAQALRRPSPVRAVDPNDVVLGATNTSSSTTTIRNTSGNSNTALRATTNGSGYGLYAESNSGYGAGGLSESGIGVSGWSTSSFGVKGWSSSGIGAFGETTSGTGVKGTSGSGLGVSGISVSDTGIYGYSDVGIGIDARSAEYIGLQARSDGNKALLAETTAAGHAAVAGRSSANRTGLLGFSVGSQFAGEPAAPAKTGVCGQATQDANSRGVWGRANAGRGVYGQATSGQGVHGYASSGTGVYASAGSGGTALEASGKVKFSGSAGLAVISSGTQSKLVTPGVDITASSKVLVTMQTGAGGTTTVHRVVRDTVNGRFTIHLTAAATQDCTVAWFVIS